MLTLGEQKKLQTDNPDTKVLSSHFIAPWWVRNRHLQTIWSSLFRRTPPLPLMQRLRLELDDGDFIDVDLCKNKDRPTALLLHGLEGSIDSSYMRGMIAAMNAKRWQILVMHFRGCSGEPNRLLQSYHSGVSEDLDQVITLLSKQSIEIDYVVGYSLGGNVLLKWLGEDGKAKKIKAAVAVSVPLLLDVCADEIHKGFSKIYAYFLLKSLRKKTRLKLSLFGKSALPKLHNISKLTSFRKFDHYFTAPVHGFEDGDHYYKKSSSKQFVAFIKIPTLILQAKDDPFMNATVIPDHNTIPKNVTLEVSEHGGHVGFVKGKWPWQAEYYLEYRIPNYLENINK